jgi:1-acyl-sn-glycerol-3-phosphate acyltransferase
LERYLRVTEPIVNALFHPVVRGIEHMPAGAALVIGNHNSVGMSPESHILAQAMRSNSGVASMPRPLAHEILFRLKPVRRLIEALGAIPASHEAADELFARGEKALVFPGGDMEAMRPFRARDRIVFGNRSGYVRLALRHDVPIVPVVTAGAHSGLVILNEGKRTASWLGLSRFLRVKRLPLALSIPWGLTLSPPPLFIPVPTHVVQEILPPIQFSRTGEDAANDQAYVDICHGRVVDTMQEALTRLAKERRSRPSG